MVKWGILIIFVGCGLWVHYRGRVRHSLARQLTDHSTFMAPYNCLAYACSPLPPQPYLKVDQFPELQVLQQQWQTIRDEALQLFDQGQIRAATGFNDVGFNSFFKTGWKRFYLKWYDDFLPSAKQACPKTMALLASLPSVNAAMFTLLPPGARLVSHRDPFAGSVRYHLGLVTPNSDDCHIFVDGEKYAWRDGEAVMFDETYIHYAENKTDQTRLILFCDVERPFKYRWMAWINRTLGHGLIRSAAAPNQDGEKVGFINKLFGPIQQVRLVGKKIKAWNRTAYYALKWLIFGGLFLWIFI